MRSETQNLKTGQWRVTPENSDDMWLLSTIIEAGDTCTAFTSRKIQVGESGAVRKNMVLTIEAEKVRFESDALRILGVVRAGPEDVPHGEHHSFQLTAGTSITIVKEHWAHDHVQRLREACDTQPPPVLIVVFDREEANIALLRRNGYQLLSHLTGQVQKKRMPQQINKRFYDVLTEAIKEYDVRFQPRYIILASPAFWKDEYLKTLDDDTLRKKLVLATTSGAHEQAIVEVLRRDEVKSALANDRVTRESRLVETIMEGIAKGSAVAYGAIDVEAAVESRAVDTLLITEAKITKAREEKSFEKFDRMMRQVDAAKGSVVIVGSHSAGKRLDGLGGVAALLRYRLS